MSTTLDQAAGFGEYLISARSFVLYTAMFALTSEDLRGSVLDCPGGGASFTATACARGVEAMAIDPAYAMTPEDLSNRLALELERGAIWARERADAYVWDFYGDPAGHATVRAESAQCFACRLRRASRALPTGGAPAPAVGRRRYQPGAVLAPALHLRRSPGPRLSSGSAAGDGPRRARSGACVSARRPGRPAAGRTGHGTSAGFGVRRPTRKRACHRLRVPARSQTHAGDRRAGPPDASTDRVPDGAL